jgi:hypothetical protein
MFSASFLVTALALLSISEPVVARERWLERDGRPLSIRFARRRFGQENPSVIAKLGAACPGEVCGNLSGAAITPLLAAQPECSQQDMADDIIDAAKQFDAATQANMIALAKEYRQVEKNTPPDFTTNPPANRNSVFCQKAPRNPELNGLVQAQDPANDPDLFFDPATKATVRKGTQANTSAFGGANANAPAPSSVPETAPSSAPAGNGAATATSAPATGATDVAADPCVSQVIVTVTVPAAASPSATTAPATGGGGGATGAEDFGTCTTPQIDFAAGFDGRKETSFQPTDKTSFNHGSAQNIDIITQFICDTLTNSCKANAAAKTLCASAITASKAAAVKTGAQADAFNGVFGITTNLAAVAAIDNQGKVIAGTGAANLASGGAVGANTGGNNAGGDAGSTGAADFGSCTTPKIEFGAGFDNRRETSFRPADLASFNHGSAQGIAIITKSICDTLTNSCKANDAAKTLCAQASTAADAAAAKTGAQADAFNGVMGITTNFAAVTALDDKGNAIAGTGDGTTSTGSGAAGTGNGNANTGGASTGTDATNAATDFGTCTTPQIEFGAGFDNRKETSFQPVDKQSFNHGSAQNIDIITQFICDTLTNSCKANAAAKAQCAQAITASKGAAVKTGAQADAFNAAMGITTNFASVQAINDQGVPLTRRRRSLTHKLRL